LGGFSKDTRFKYESVDRKLNEISPGPTTATLDISLPRIGTSRRNNSINYTQINLSSRDRFKDNKKIFFRELEREI